MTKISLPYIKKNNTKAKIEYITSEDHRTQIIEDNKVVIIDYFADWCGPCKEISDEYEKLANDFKDIKFCKENVDLDLEGISDKITGIPCFHFYIDSKCIKDKTIKGADMKKVQNFLIEINQNKNSL
jgi:thioredoxin 1